MTKAAMPSARAWPKGWESSAGLAMIQKPMITTMEVSVSDSVCQASATMEID